MNKKNFHVVMSKYAKKLYAIEILLQKKLLEVFLLLSSIFLGLFEKFIFVDILFRGLAKIKSADTHINLFNI